jgi:beta-lactamase regulating signal transducer with metallopeptidase domain/multidrug resistance efflux pump
VSTIIPLDTLWAQVLAWTLVHFIWQGAAIGLAAFLLLRIAHLTAASRYAAGVTALVVMLAAPVVTFVVLEQEPAPAVQIIRGRQALETSDVRFASNAQTLQRSDSRTLSDPKTLASSDLRTLTPSLIIVVWLAGVVALSVRLLGGWLVARRLVTRAVQPAAPEIRALARRLAGRLRLDRMVRLFESSAVVVPVTIGWLKPVVLLPAAAMTGLSMAQIEALLAHELAHVWRYDYLVNLLQSAVETLLFYHPAVWWVSKLVRTEREHCCDDAAINVCDRLVYVTALSDLAAIGTPCVVMGASSGSLLRRVQRILGSTPGEDQAGAGWLPAFVLILLAGAFGPAALTSAPAAIQGESPAGVQAGVAGGVVGGRQEGITGGIAGGIPAGIKGGVSGAVAGGMVGVARGVSQSAGSASQSGQRQVEEARRAELEQKLQALERAGEGVQQEAEIAKLETALKLARDRYERVKRLVEVGLETPPTLAEIEVELSMIERKIVAARQGGQHQEQNEKIADLMAQLEIARLRLERTNRLFAAGLVSASAVKEAEAEVTTMEAKLIAFRKQLQLQESEADLRSRQAERQAEIAEIERVLREIGTSGQEERRRTAEQQAKQEARSIDAAFAEIEARHSAANASERDQRFLSASTPVADANETVRTGDLLVIEIAGEPDLPRVYVVGATGAIRLPLIGNVRVLGLTTLQVREAVRSELNKRQLADDPRVTVSLRRVR